jgi:hypothetical protein
MNDILNPNNPVVLFIPEAGIYPYMRGLAVLGDAIKKQGGQVLVTRDTGQMLRSPIMTMNRTPINASEKERAKINRANNKILKSAQKKYKFSTIELSDLVDSQLMKEIDNLVNVSDKDLENITFKECPIGKIAQYDFILETKSPYSSEVSEEYKALYKTYIKNAALAVAITDEICQRFHPSLIINFNEYAECQAVRYSAETNNIPRVALTHPVHFGIDTSRFLIKKSAIGYFFYPHCQKWNDVKEIPITPQFVRECWDDSVFRFFGTGGSHIFSSRKNGNPALIFNKLKLDPNKKTVVAYTSSSDERHGMDILMKAWGEGTPFIDAFPDQIAWLSMLRDYATKRDNVQIIVRIHPREGSRQFGFDSPHLKQLKSAFTKNTPNFYIIWPDDPISSYDLMELADICLVSWSTVGQEAARLGIPVLAYTGNMSYPDDDFIQVATTREEYKKRLDSLLSMTYTWQHLVKAIRLYHWRTFIPSLDLGETVPMDIMDDTIWPEAPSSKVSLINDILSGKQDLIKYNIEQWQASLPKDALTQESEAMRQWIRYFLDKTFYPPVVYNKKIVFLFRVYRKARKILLHLFGKKVFILNSTKHHFADYCLEFTTDISHLEELREKTKYDKSLRILVEDKLDAILIHKGKMIRRMSPMVIHLAKLYDSSVR